MNTLTGPVLPVMPAQDLSATSQFTTGEQAGFGAALEEKLKSMEPAVPLPALQPEIAVTLPDAQNSTGFETLLNADQSAINLAAAPVMQLMIEVDKVAQALHPVAEHNGNEANSELQRTDILRADILSDEQGATATVEPQDKKTDITGSIAVTAHQEGKNTASSVLAQASNGPTAAAQASITGNDLFRKERQQSEQPASQPAKASELSSAAISASQLVEKEGAVQPIQGSQPAPIVTASLSTQVPVQTAPLAQSAPVPVPAAVIHQEMGTEAWRQSLNQHINIFTRNGIQNAELRLNPLELGVIRVNMQLNSEQATLHFVSDNHQVRAALEAAMPQLRTSLAESGIELGESSVGAESSPSWSKEERAERFASHDDEKGETALSLSDSEGVITETRIQAGGINTFA